MDDKKREHLKKAADQVWQHMAENPGVPVPVLDPEVAEFMGVFEEKAMSLADAVEGCVGVTIDEVPE